MRTFKDKKTGIIYNVTSPSIVEVFEKNTDYEEVKNKKNKDKKNTDNKENIEE